MQRLALAVATAGPAGWFPIAPGTVGSAVGLAVWWTARAAGTGLVGELLLVAALVALGAWAAGAAEHGLGVTDPGPVVIDEVMGMVLTMVAAPPTWPAALAGFLLFRVFDIVKPPPARRLERWPGGWGIMADDFAAGVYGWVALQGLLRVAPGWLA